MWQQSLTDKISIIYVSFHKTFHYLDKIFFDVSAHLIIISFLLPFQTKKITNLHFNVLLQICQFFERQIHKFNTINLTEKKVSTYLKRILLEFVYQSSFS